MKLQKILTVLTVTTLTLVGCSSNQESASNQNHSNHDKSHDHSSHSASTTSHSFKEISGEELQKIQLDDKEKEKYLVIDTRSADQYKEGHLKHAINIPFKTFKDNISRLESFKNKAIILYCHGKQMSIDAATMLKEAGFTDLTVAPGVTEYKDYQFVKFASITGADFQKVLTSTKDGNVYIDAREEKDYNVGHASEAIWIDSKNMEGIEAKLPTDKETAIYTYCYSGNRAAVVAQKLVELGYTNVTNVLDGTKEFEYKF